MQRYIKTLTIAGSDSGGCAGIQADLKTFCALDCFGMSVVVALTAQNTIGVHGVRAVDPAFIGEQMDAIFSDSGVDAIKIGMLYDKQTVLAVSEKLPSNVPIVVDPVMVSTTGCRLLASDAVEAMKEYLFPRATLITPNLFEAAALSGHVIRDKKEMEHSARELLKWGSDAVLVKGGHLQEECGADCLATEDQLEWFISPMIDTRNTHGSGCTYSAAITAYLAKQRELPVAILEAKSYVSKAMTKGAGYLLGKGSGPLYHGVTV